MTAAIDDVAAAILARTGEVTTWKLQKLAYYSQAWHLVKFGQRLVDENFEAWRQGPVARELYDRHRGRNKVSTWPSGNASNLTSSESELIDWVISQYGSFSAEALSRMSHIESPWLAAREALPADAHSETVIDPNMMRTFHSRQTASPEDSVAIAVANSSIEGVELDEEWQDRLRQVAQGEVTADAVIEDEIRRVRGV